MALYSHDPKKIWPYTVVAGQVLASLVDVGVVWVDDKAEGAPPVPLLAIAQVATLHRRPHCTGARQFFFPSLHAAA